MSLDRQQVKDIMRTYRDEGPDYYEMFKDVVVPADDPFHGLLESIKKQGRRRERIKLLKQAGAGALLLGISVGPGIAYGVINQHGDRARLKQAQENVNQLNSTQATEPVVVGEVELHRSKQALVMAREDASNNDEMAQGLSNNLIAVAGAGLVLALANGMADWSPVAPTTFRR
jgi:hypothetical protein